MKNENTNKDNLIQLRYSAADVLEEIPDLESMAIPELKEYHRDLEDVLARLDAAEPRNENSEAYEQWAQEHEDLEDLIDEVLDRIEELA